MKEYLELTPYSGGKLLIDRDSILAIMLESDDKDKRPFDHQRVVVTTQTEHFSVKEPFEFLRQLMLEKGHIISCPNNFGPPEKDQAPF